MDSLVGFVDSIRPDRVSGWCAKRTLFGYRKVLVRVYIDDIMIGEGMADRERLDLETAGYGDGKHGFDIHFYSHYLVYHGEIKLTAVYSYFSIEHDFRYITFGLHEKTIRELNVWALDEFLVWPRLRRLEILKEAYKLNDDCERIFVIEIMKNKARLWGKAGPASIFSTRADYYCRLIQNVLKIGDIKDCVVILNTEDEPPVNGVPIFVFQKKIGSCNILVPDIDFLLNDFYKYENDPVVYEVKEQKASFVGSTTGAGHITLDRLERNLVPRVRLARFAKNDNRLDVRLTQLIQCDKDVEEQIKKEGLSGDFVPWKDQSSSRFLISIDGNGATCSRVYLSLVSNSVLLKYDSEAVLFYFKGLQSGRHFLSIREDHEILAILEKNSNLYRCIAVEGQNFAKEYLSECACLHYTYALLLEYANRFSLT